MRGAEDRCIAVVFIKRVEKFSEGYYANDFLVSCSTTASFRLTSSFEDARPYSISDFRDQGLGTHGAPEVASGKLKGFVSKAFQIKLTSPSDAVLKRLTFDILPKRGKGLARAALSQITQALPLDQIWASGTGDKLGPFGNFAARLLSLHGYDPSQATTFLKTSDPFYLYADTTGNIIASKSEDSAKRGEMSVDLEFTEIDPTKIYAREFIPSEGFFPDLESALNKTEEAEKLHQNMLRDISSYLKEKGVSTYESSSVDLMILLNDQTRIFEIKSSTLANIMAQAAKGAFQIACYCNAMDADHGPLSAALIIHKIEDTNVETFVHNALKRLGVKCLTYDPDRQWPQRVAGLLS